ncbi:MAG: TlpA disulfide reductase family protein [Chloroflexota bacterium]|nr:TlpA disulfide reductase family protein [Chloroflexota bacterium]
MSKKTRLIIMTIVIVVVVAIVGIALSCSSSLLSQEAPDFTLPTMTGSNITLSELEGTPVVLNFWASGCGPCRMELPYFEAVAQESEGEIKVIAINVGESASTVQTFFGDYEPTMTVALDKNGEVFVNYCQEDNPRWYIPITFLIDSEGIVRHIKIGAFQSKEELWETLDSVF